MIEVGEAVAQTAAENAIELTSVLSLL